jgi:hypothetical protein
MRNPGLQGPDHNWRSRAKDVAVPGNFREKPMS